MKTNTKKLVAITLGVVAAAGLGFGLAALTMQPQTEVVTVTKEVPYVVEKEVPKIVNVTKEVPVEVIKYVNKTVYVDNGNLNKVLQFMYDEEGNVEYVVDGLDDNQLNEIVDRIVFINDIKSMAVEKVKSKLFEKLDGMEVSGITLYEDDMERLKVNDDYNDIEIENIDFDDEDAKLLLSGTFEQHDTKYDFEAEVRFKDGDFYKLKVLNVELH